MYEWIVDSISSLFVPHTGQKSAAWPRNGNPRLLAAEGRGAQLGTSLSRAAKRNYQSVHSPEGRAEHSEIKRPRKDVVATILKKTVSGVVGFLGFQDPFTTPCSFLGEQIQGEEQLGVDEIQRGGVSPWLRRMEMKREKSRDIGYTGHPPSLLRKHNGVGSLAERTKSREHRRSLQFLPAHPSQSGAPVWNSDPPSVVLPNRIHKSCLAVEEAMKESDRERYRLLVEMVSEKCTMNKPLPFAQSRPPVKPLLQEVHKASVLNRVYDSTGGGPRHVRVNTSLRVCRDAPSSGPNKGMESEKPEPHPPSEKSKGGHVQVCVQAEDAVLRCRENNLSSAPLLAPSETQEPAAWKQPVDVHLSAEVATRLNLVDRESVASTCLLVKPQQPTLDGCRGQEEFPRLTKEMLQEVNQALAQKDPNVVLSSAFKLRITQRDLATLQDSSWLNDEVINFYMNLLMCRSERGEGRKVYAFSTFFYPKLHGGGHAAVRRWTKAVDLFQHDVIVVPLHLGVHWSLAVIDFRARSVKYYDSVGQRRDDICNLLLHYVKEEYKAKKNKDLDMSKWVMVSLKAKEIPQQNNSNDCGVFACKYADYIAQGRPLTFTQSHMPYFRRKMIWEILNKRLL